MQRVTITDVRTIADGVRTFTLACGDASCLPAWEPGAHIDVHLPSGTVRQYSLCGDPADRTKYVVAVLQNVDGRGGSLEMHGLRHGQEIGISSPRNNFPLLPAERYVFIAGGIGITPILPMIEQVDRQGTSWRLVYGGRTRRSMAFIDRLDHLGGDVTVVAEDTHGYPDLPTILSPAEPDTLIYCCGPAGLLDAVEKQCGGEWEAGALNTERFSSPDRNKLPDVHEDGGTVELQLGVEGPVVSVAADQTLLDAMIAAGCDVMYSCQEGICGSCEIAVVAGDPDHRDSLLTAAQRNEGLMLPCVSRSRSTRLVVDVEPP
ncbi:PDR/VanB family oxidoreductase [Rhodococcus erythropolis]